MSRISKEAKRIANLHMKAALTGEFDNPKVSTREEVMKALHDGKTFRGVLDEIEARYVPFGTIMVSAVLGHHSAQYKKCIYKGFKELIDEPKPIKS